MNKKFFFIGLFSFFLCSFSASAQEKYADVSLAPEGWSMREMQTFSGSVPSRAWLYGRGDAETVVSVMLTEGITGGLAGQSPAALAKLYVEAFITGWGGKTERNDPGEESAAFCGGRPGYTTTGIFGGVSHDYYGCFIMREDHMRIVSAVTWVPRGTPESTAAHRLKSIIDGISMPVPGSDPVPGSEKRTPKRIPEA